MENNTGSAPTAPQATTNTQTQANVQYQSDSGFTAAQTKQMAEWAVKDGKLTSEQASEKLVADGHEPLAKAADSQQEFEWPVGSPKDFQLPSLFPDETNLGPSHKQATEKIRDSLSAGKFSPEIGSYVISEAAKVESKWKNMTTDERKTYAQQEKNNFDNFFKDQAPQKMDSAIRFLDDLDKKHPIFMNYLSKTGAIYSSAILAQLANHGERVFAKGQTR